MERPSKHKFVDQLDKSLSSAQCIIRIKMDSGKFDKVYELAVVSSFQRFIAFYSILIHVSL